MNATLQQMLHDLARLQVLRELALIDGPKETLYDKLTETASNVIGAPVSLISMVGADKQFFKSMVGLPEPWASDRQTPLSHSFCQHVAATNKPLVVTDAREVDFLKDNMAIPDLDVIGYLGMPLTLEDGKGLGSFCVIDSSPRQWTQTEIDIMQEFSEIITSEIDLRAAVNRNPALQPKLDEARKTILALINSLDTTVSKDQFLNELRSARATFEV